jgi:hypothetical protein
MMVRNGVALLAVLLTLLLGVRPLIKALRRDHRGAAKIESDESESEDSETAEAEDSEPEPDRPELIPAQIPTPGSSIPNCSDVRSDWPRGWSANALKRPSPSCARCSRTQAEPSR